MTVFQSTRPSVSIRVPVRFPARIVTDGAITLTIANGVYTFSIDQTALAQSIVNNPTFFQQVLLASLPTVLPGTPGVLWNNGGVLSVS